MDGVEHAENRKGSNGGDEESHGGAPYASRSCSTQGKRMFGEIEAQLACKSFIVQYRLRR